MISPLAVYEAERRVGLAHGAGERLGMGTPRVSPEEGASRRTTPWPRGRAGGAARSGRLSTLALLEAVARGDVSPRAAQRMLERAAR